MVFDIPAIKPVFKTVFFSTKKTFEFVDVCCEIHKGYFIVKFKKKSLKKEILTTLILLLIARKRSKS